MSRLGAVVGLVLALVKLIWSFLEWLKERTARQAGREEMQRHDLESTIERQQKAKDAADRVRAAHVRDPAGVLRDNDGFRRD